MNYETIDRDMSSWVVICEKNGTTFYLTEDGYASDLFCRARRYRYIQDAELAAITESDDYAWRGMAPWRAISVPEAINLRVRPVAREED